MERAIPWVVAVGYYLLLCRIPPTLAKARGKEEGALFWLAVFATPLLAMLYVLGLPAGSSSTEGTVSTRLRKSGPHVHQPDGHGFCGLCGERIGG